MIEKILVPNIGDFKNVEIIEVLVNSGEKIKKGDPIVTLESDKSSVEVPSTHDGTIDKVKIRIGDKVSEGDLILTINPEKAIIEKKEVKEIKEPVKNQSRKRSEVTSIIKKVASSGIVGASPNVMRFARELGVDLSKVQGSGRDGRVLEIDIKDHIKSSNNLPSPKKAMLEESPYSHSEFGDVKVDKIPRIKRLSGPHLVNAWSTIPHVTQHDEIDVTEMETFRKNLTDLNTKEKIPITPIAFIIRALVNAMQKYPNFNSSIDPKKEEIIFKKYFHIGIAVDTPHGLMVPKIRNVNNKDLLTISKELRKISKECKELKIDKKEFFGGSMTISSLGGIGGSFFTPIINPPEVCILGVGRTENKQVFINGKFQRRMMMPISLSYDHRIIDGAEAARFCQDLKTSLGRNFAFKLAI
ncbi:MAG: dihydrolipoamide acetyltransferase [Candidatus Pelagibacter sp.]|nr:dihydrolipoamide acetyltransferase [Candidatus Pelagibacter sp.]OUV98170.1 MAG: dihydrolipoamide acetyltransferase [Candidatus Pelagibacter sp. TMED142]